MPMPDTVTIGPLMFVRDRPGVTTVRLARHGDPNGDGEAIGYAEPVSDDDWAMFVRQAASDDPAVVR